MKLTHPGEQLSMDKIRELLRLSGLGYSQNAIAQSCGMARSTVQDYLRLSQVKGLSYEQAIALSDSEIQARLGKGQRQPSEPVRSIDFAAVEQGLHGKGVTLSLPHRLLPSRIFNSSLGE
jgi:IS30 family transposase